MQLDLRDVVLDVNYVDGLLATVEASRSIQAGSPNGENGPVMPLYTTGIGDSLV